MKIKCLFCSSLSIHTIFLISLHYLIASYLQTDFLGELQRKIQRTNTSPWSVTGAATMDDSVWLSFSKNLIWMTMLMKLPQNLYGIMLICIEPNSGYFHRTGRRRESQCPSMQSCAWLGLPIVDMEATTKALVEMILPMIFAYDFAPFLLVVPDIKKT